VLAGQWSEHEELFKLREDLRVVTTRKAMKNRKLFHRYLKNGREGFAEMAIKDPEFEEFYFFEILSALCYFGNINSMEAVIKFADLIKKNGFAAPAETLKGVLTKKGVELENEIISLLVK
jgi:hypothetical protein